MKIAILTHPLGANYGGILQAYALSRYLEKQGHQVCFLNREPDLPFVKRIIKKILIICRHPRYKNPRYKQLRQFINKHINYSYPLMTSREMTSFVKKQLFDAVIVGSDQVWRNDFAMGYGYNYFLDFVPKNLKKLSYAASFGLSEWGYTEKQTKIIKQQLSMFDSISVREDEGVLMCRNYLQIDAVHVLDPTFLLYAEEYDPIINTRLINDPYVFVYWLGTEEDKQTAISKYKESSKIIIDISPRDSVCLISIEEWLSYIKYADVILTDSFHGCVFSIIFKKKFKVFSNKSGGDGRLQSLFRMFKIAPCNDQIDYSKISSLLKGYTEMSYKYLSMTLE